MNWVKETHDIQRLSNRMILIEKIPNWLNASQFMITTIIRITYDIKKEYIQYKKCISFLQCLKKEE